MAPTEERFHGFVKESLGMVVAIAASIPMLVDYLDIIESPVIGPKKELLPMAVAIISAFVFLALFWHRHRLAGLRSLVLGLSMAGAGMVMVITYIGSNAAAQEQIAATDAGTPLAAGTTMTITHVALYTLGALLLLTGTSIIFVHGFVRQQHRQDIMQDILPSLGANQWSSVEDFARTQYSVYNDTRFLEKAGAPLRAGSERLFRQMGDGLALLRQGSLEIRGPEIEDVFNQFVAATGIGIRATSFDDLDYWASDESADYFRLNQQVVESGRSVERIFIIASRPDPEHVSAIHRQIAAGFVVRVITSDDVRRVDRDAHLRMDFGLFDDFAVGFWRVSAGRLFRVDTEPGLCRKYTAFFERMRVSAQLPPGGTEPVFRTVEEFDLWLAAFDSEPRSKAAGSS